MFNSEDIERIALQLFGNYKTMREIAIAIIEEHSYLKKVLMQDDIDIYIDENLNEDQKLLVLYDEFHNAPPEKKAELYESLTDYALDMWWWSIKSFDSDLEWEYKGISSISEIRMCIYHRFYETHEKEIKIRSIIAPCYKNYVSGTSIYTPKKYHQKITKTNVTDISYVDIKNLSAKYMLQLIKNNGYLNEDEDIIITSSADLLTMLSLSNVNFSEFLKNVTTYTKDVCTQLAEYGIPDKNVKIYTIWRDRTKQSITVGDVKILRDCIKMCNNLRCSIFVDASIAVRPHVKANICDLKNLNQVLHAIYFSNPLLDFLKNE